MVGVSDPVEQKERPISTRPPIRRRFNPPQLTPEQLEYKVAMHYHKEDTADWFAVDSSLEYYEQKLGFKKEDLEGKVVIDLGTSPSDRLARDLKDAGIHATVLGLSPDLKRESMRLHPSLPEGHVRQGMAAIAQAIPVKDNSVDAILGLFSVTWVGSTYPQQVNAWVSEFGRVLAPGGEARVGPTYGGQDQMNRYSMGKNFEKLIEMAHNAGLEIEIHELDFEKDPENREDYFLFRKPQNPAA